MKILRWLLVFVPVSIVLRLVGVPPIWMFLVSAMAIIPLAGLLGEATEEIALYTNPRLGGFLNATFGNATELILAIMALRAGLTDVVKASIAGSVIGNLLLVLGASWFLGGIRFKTQHFNRKAVQVTSSLLLLSVLAVTLPAIFTSGIEETALERSTSFETMSVIIAALMFVMYLAGLFFSFFTHKDIYGSEHTEETETTQKRWTLPVALGVLIGATVIIALESEFLVAAIEPVTETFGISRLFIGIILVPIIGNAAEHSTAVVMAMKNKMEVAVEIAVGSSLQIILFVMPVLVMIGLFVHPMSIRFTMAETAALIASVFICNRVTDDGESNWLEGLMLITVYAILAVSFATIG